MATDRQVGKKVSGFVRQEDTPGLRVDPGPYIGIVKNTLDDLRAGRLEVFIPELGGNPDDPKNWRLVNYASPFMGSTKQPLDNKLNQFDKTEHTYGMWFVPPDIGNEVLVTFVMGDPNRGYWFACVNPGLSHHMIPGMASAKNLNKTDIVDPELKTSLVDDGVYPSAEFNTKVPELSKSATFLTNPRTIHEYQTKVLIGQGLDRDAIRGAISSSSQREAPSSVFGISTPGRPLGRADTAENYVAYANKLNKRELTAKDYQFASRKGGHTFVMDDGDAAGNDQLIRLRTAGGHQLLMNDKERLVYIGNSDGSVWVELSGNGHVHIYSARGINIRTQGDFNLHSDQNVNINAGGAVNISAQKSFVVEGQTCAVTAQTQATLFGSDVGIGSNGTLTLSSTGRTSVKAGASLDLVGSTINLNSGSAKTVTQPDRIKTNNLSDTTRDQKSKLWVSKNGSLATIVTIAPAHEPWPRRGASGAGTVAQSATQAIPQDVTATTDTTAASQQPAAITSEEYIDAGLMVKDPCTISPRGNTSSDTINKGPAPEFSMASIECGRGGRAPDWGPQKAFGFLVKNTKAKLAPKEYMARKDAATPPGGIGPLTVLQVKAIMVAMGFRESSWDYRKKNTAGFIGKYQFGAQALTSRGLIKPDYLKAYNDSNKVLTQPAAWRSPNSSGVYSTEDWLASPGTQERIMYEQLVSNYRDMTLPGNRLSTKLSAEERGIRPTDDVCTVGGMLCVAHLLGATGATLWRHGKPGRRADDFGTTGEEYFNIGRYAVDVLARAASPTTQPTATPAVTGATTLAPTTPATATPAPTVTPAAQSTTSATNTSNRKTGSSLDGKDLADMTVQELQSARTQTQTKLKAAENSYASSTGSSKVGWKMVIQSTTNFIAAIDKELARR